VIQKSIFGLKAPTPLQLGRGETISGVFIDSPDVKTISPPRNRGGDDGTGN